MSEDVTMEQARSYHEACAMVVANAYEIAMIGGSSTLEKVKLSAQKALEQAKIVYPNSPNPLSTVRSQTLEKVRTHVSDTSLHKGVTRIINQAFDSLQ